MNRLFRWAALLSLVLVSLGAAVGAVRGQDEIPDRSELRFIVVSHGQASDPF